MIVGPLLLLLLPPLTREGTAGEMAILPLTACVEEDDADDDVSFAAATPADEAWAFEEARSVLGDRISLMNTDRWEDLSKRFLP